jgi:hypothetical protein
MSDATAPEVRSSLKTQAKVAHLGAVLGFNIWVPASDRAKIIELVPANSQERFVTSLPLNYDLTTLKTIENIDVIWLLRRSIVHAFEVEHTTAIYSGLWPTFWHFSPVWYSTSHCCSKRATRASAPRDCASGLLHHGGWFHGGPLLVPLVRGC